MTERVQGDFRSTKVGDCHQRGVELGGAEIDPEGWLGRDHRFTSAAGVEPAKTGLGVGTERSGEDRVELRPGALVDERHRCRRPA